MTHARVRAALGAADLEVQHGMKAVADEAVLHAVRLAAQLGIPLERRCLALRWRDPQRPNQRRQGGDA